MASPITVFANSYMADGSLTGWINPTYVYADDGVNFATRTGTAKNTWYGNLFGFNFTSIPDGSTINSITFTVEWKNSANDASGPVLYLGAQSEGVEIGIGDSDTTGQTGFEILSHTVTGLTAAQLKATGANGFWAILRFRRTDNTAHIASVDYLKCVVEYAEPSTVLIIQNVTQIQVLDSLTLSAIIPQFTLSIADVTQTQGLETPDITGHLPSTLLVIQNVGQLQSIDTPALVYHVAHYSLVINNVAQSHAIDNLVLSANVPQFQLVIANINQVQGIGTANLVQHNKLTIANITQMQSIQVPILTTYALAGVTLQISDVTQVQTLGDVGIVTTAPHYALIIDDVIQIQSIESIIFQILIIGLSILHGERRNFTLIKRRKFDLSGDMRNFELRGRKG